MKNKILHFGFALMTVVLFASCEKTDSGSDSLSGHIRVYGTDFPILSGVVWQSNKNVVVGKEEFIWQDEYTTASGNDTTVNVKGFFRSDAKTESGNFMISLYGDGLVYSSDLSLAKGKGAVVCFHLASEDLENLKPGKYTFADSKMPGTFLGYMSTNYDMSNSSSEIVAYIVGGELTVNVNNAGEYTINFNGTLDSTLPLNVNYSGTLNQCKVKQLTMSSAKGLYFGGISPKITINTWWAGFIDNGFTYEDDTKNTGLYLGSDVIVVNAGTTNKEGIEMALTYDTVSTKFCFASPITMRGFLSHQDKFSFPCHTVYMKAPATFTDADFNNLEETGISFDITAPEKVEFNSDGEFKPGYVFFDAGTGAKGVIKVKGVNPKFKTSDEANYYTYKYTTNPQLICDIKAPSNFTNPLIR